jgi:hypothetical protein
MSCAVGWREAESSPDLTSRNSARFVSDCERRRCANADWHARRDPQSRLHGHKEGRTGQRIRRNKWLMSLTTQK